MQPIAALTAQLRSLPVQRSGLNGYAPRFFRQKPIIEPVDPAPGPAMPPPPPSDPPPPPARAKAAEEKA
ncbi:uncharacterized protein N0V96_000591 [Colletotrichum fioriniae]|uniref:uncharacterized protein n=1 Tax=Colletotrichum fioriniae TaxID=710243 RepID=UPI0032DA625A|nr:hypothetical protein N0V96_000591 [Colletotrichum fioriniae]